MKKLYSLLLVMVALVAIGAYQTVNIGTSPNDGTGDTLRAAFTKVNDNTAQTIADLAAVEAHIVNSTNWPGYSFWVTNFQPLVNFGTVQGNVLISSNSIWIPKAGLGSIDTYMSQGFFRTTNSSSATAIGLVLDGANFNVVGTGLNTLVNVNQSGVVTASNFVHSTWKWVDILISGTSIASNPSGDPPELRLVPGGSNFIGYAYYYDNSTTGDKSYFSIQGIHKFAQTNAANPDLWFEPHIHVLCTNMPATLSNVTFQLDLVYAPVFGQFTNGYLATKTFAFTNAYQHGVLSFGNVTNNALSGRSSVIFKGRIMRIQGGNGELGAANPVWVDSLDLHMPTQEMGSSGQTGD